MSVGLAPEWRDYRNRRRLVLGTLAVIPMLAVAAPALFAVGVNDVSAHVLLASCATSLVAGVGRFAAFRCPYCTRPFHWTWIVANPLSRECLHCGFAKWRDPHGARELRGR